jgi:glc operon protein GlcG
VRSFLFVLSCILFVGCQSLSSDEPEVVKQSMGTRKILTLVLAKKMAQAIEDEAKVKNEKVSISIYDIGGDLKYFQRMENSGFGSISLSQLKAKTSVLFPLSSKKIAEQNVKIPSNPYSFIPDIILLPGGLPIFTKDKEHIGSVGISGSSQPSIDEELAQKGIDAIAESL